MGRHGVLRGGRVLAWVGWFCMIAMVMPEKVHASNEAPKNVNVVRSVYAGFERGDVDAVVELMDDKVDWTIPGPTTIPFAGAFKGKDGVRRFFEIAVDLLTVRDQHVDRYIVQGDTVVALGFEDMTVKASGKSYRSSWAHVFTIRKGKIVKFQEYVDTAAQAAAFGH